MSGSKCKSCGVAGTSVPFKISHYKIKYIYFCLLFMYYLCDNNYKPITVQYYMADCVTWVPPLTLLDL